MQGSPLCIYQATLSFLAPTVIEKNKEYGRSTLWSSSCYVKIDKKVQLEKTVGETLSALLESFKADYREAHPKGEAMPTIYLLE